MGQPRPCSILKIDVSLTTEFRQAKSEPYRSESALIGDTNAYECEAIYLAKHIGRAPFVTHLYTIMYRQLYTYGYLLKARRRTDDPRLVSSDDVGNDLFVSANSRSSRRTAWMTRYTYFLAQRII